MYAASLAIPPLLRSLVAVAAGSRAEHDGRSSACVTRHNDWGWVWQLNSRVTGPTVHIRYSMDAWNCGRPPNRYPEVAAGCGALPARTGRQSAQGCRRVGTRRTARYVQSWSILRPPVSSCLDRHRAMWRQHVYTLQSPSSTPVGPGHATSRTPCSPAAGVAGGRRRRSCWGRASV